MLFQAPNNFVKNGAIDLKYRYSNMLICDNTDVIWSESPSFESGF